MFFYILLKKLKSIDGLVDVWGTFTNFAFGTKFPIFGNIKDDIMADKAMEILTPGSLLRKELKEKGLTQRKFAEEVGMRPSHVSEIISGKRPVSKAMALKFQEALGVPAEEWLKLQVKVDVNSKLDDSEIKAAEELIKFDDILSLKDMFKRCPLGKDSSCVEKLTFLKEAIGVDSFEGAKTSVDKLVAGGFFRKSEKTGLDARMIATWVALAREEAHKQTLMNTFDKGTLGNLVGELSGIFHKNSDTIYRLMSTLNRYGIKFCIVEKVNHASIDGYSFLDNGVPTIVVTKRYNRIDHLAFSVMHEVCHIYKHLTSSDDQRLNIECEDFDVSKEEKEANEFAANALVPIEKWNAMPPMTLNFAKPWFFQNQCAKWANDNGLNKWIVLGRVSHVTGIYRFKSDSSRAIN